MSTNMRRRGLTAAATSGSSTSVAMMKLPTGNTRERSSGSKPSAYALVVTITSAASMTRPRCHAQPSVGKLLERAGGAVVVHVGAGIERQPRQPGWKPCRVEPTCAFEHDTAVERGRADLVGQLVAGHEAHRLARVGVLLHGLAERRARGGGCGRGTAGRSARSRNRSLVGDQRLDLVEGLVHLVRTSGGRPGRTSRVQRGRARLQLGDDHAAVAGVRAPAEASFSSTTTSRPAAASLRAAASPA